MPDSFLANPFNRVDPDDFVEGLNIREMFGLRETKGQVGLEVECEGAFFPKSSEHYYTDGGEEDLSKEIPKQWEYTHDGSLRGEDNAEYILAKPLDFDEVPKAIDDLWYMFERVESELDESNRTSVHVHLNVQDWHTPRLCSFIALYYIVEDILTHWCGEHRVGNLFCLRAKDAPGLVSRVRKFLQTENSQKYFNSGMHYSGLNLLALQKLGSIEVRAMRGTTDPEVLKTWVEILRRIYELSAEYPDPREIVQGFSGQPREDFVSAILGPFTQRIKDECGMSSYHFNKSLHEGVRLAQQICFARDWSKYQCKVVEYDMFNRNTDNLSTLMPVSDETVSHALDAYYDIVGAISNDELVAEEAFGDYDPDFI